MCYVAVMAKFSYLYQKYDVQYATQCLQHASSVYTKLMSTSGRDAEKFMALTELYRAAGLYTYRNQILEYKDFFEDNTSYLEETAYLYGSMTYPGHQTAGGCGPVHCIHGKHPESGRGAGQTFP